MERKITAHLSGRGHVTGDAYVDGKARLERARPGVALLFAEIISFKIEYARETSLGSFVHQ